MSDTKALPDVMTADEVADYLRVSKTTVCRWCKDGKLSAFRIGRGWRVQRSALESHIRHAAQTALAVEVTALVERNA